jgi:hypothetical protein
LTCHVSLAQEKEPIADKIINFPTSFLNKVQNKYANLEDRLTKQTEKYLLRLAKREKRLKKKLAKVDSAAAEQTFGNIDAQYDKMLAAVRTDSLPTKKRSGAYIPMIDSVKTSLAFLDKNNSILEQGKGVTDKIKGSVSQVNQLQSRLQQSEQVKAFIQQRKQQIKSSLSKFTSLPKNLMNDFTDFNKEAYYYSAQLKEYKDMLNNPDKLIQKGLSLLNKLPAFTQFMKQKQ